MSNLPSFADNAIFYKKKTIVVSMYYTFWNETIYYCNYPKFFGNNVKNYQILISVSMHYQQVLKPTESQNP